jgi:Sulfotransferase domain.
MTKLGLHFISVAIIATISIVNIVFLVVWAHVYVSKIIQDLEQQQQQVFQFSRPSSSSSLSSLASSVPANQHNYYDSGRGAIHGGDSPSNHLPKVVWLMSFPNSGNSFTTQMVRMHTNHFTATNYGEEHIGENGTSMSIHHDPFYANGPFLSESITKGRKIGNYVLTKTHCGGRCSRCGPETYLETLESFQTACLTARRGTSHDGVISFEKVQYSESLVHGAIHIVRDPFDNIVSRFHLIQKVNKKLGGDDKFEKTFPNNLHGFRKWCKYMDKQYLDSEAKMLDIRIMEIFQSIPCHSDFFRYVQWHNLAFQVTQVMDLPYIIVHYEDYGRDFNSVKDEILLFLELRDDGYRNVTFSSGKTYHDYFTEDERRAVQNLFHLLASNQTKEHIERYFKK